ncbi:MAG: hypothetical protein Q4B63_11715 [Clostridium perfringens]|nr:hypothetical protein [Clostridium perfringens]
MVKEYFYNLYGLMVKSELEINELVSLKNRSTSNHDVEIKIDKVPNEKLEKIPNNSWFLGEGDNFTFSIDNVANYHISKGNEIIVDSINNSPNQPVKTFLLGTSFGMLLQQRNTVAIHGGTVIVDNKSIVITGDQGAGKSTLVNGFRHRGFGFMADDVSVTGLDENNNIVIKSAYPQQKVCKDAMIKMGYNLENFKLIDEGRQKYVVSVSKTFRREDLNLGAIFYITKDNVKEVKIEEVKGTEKLNIVINNIYRIEILRLIGMNKEYFRKCLDIAKRIPIYKITRPANGFTIDDQMKEIEKIMKKY